IHCWMIESPPRRFFSANSAMYAVATGTGTALARRGGPERQRSRGGSRRCRAGPRSTVRARPSQADFSRDVAEEPDFLAEPLVVDLPASFVPSRLFDVPPFAAAD